MSDKKALSEQLQFECEEDWLEFCDIYHHAKLLSDTLSKGQVNYPFRKATVVIELVNLSKYVKIHMHDRDREFISTLVSVCPANSHKYSFVGRCGIGYTLEGIAKIVREEAFSHLTTVEEFGISYFTCLPLSLLED